MHRQEALAAHEAVHQRGGDLGPAGHPERAPAIQDRQPCAVLDAPGGVERELAVLAVGHPGPQDVAGADDLGAVAHAEPDAPQQQSLEHEEAEVPSLRLTDQVRLPGARVEQTASARPAATAAAGSAIPKNRSGSWSATRTGATSVA